MKKSIFQKSVDEIDPHHDFDNLGYWVYQKRKEYKAKDDAGTIADWEMDVLNWLDTYKE